MRRGESTCFEARLLSVRGGQVVNGLHLSQKILLEVNTIEEQNQILNYTKDSQTDSWLCKGFTGRHLVTQRIHGQILGYTKDSRADTWLHKGFTGRYLVIQSIHGQTLGYTKDSRADIWLYRIHGRVFTNIVFVIY